MTETRDKAGEPGSGGEPATGPGTCPVVGIGASAGGVDALKRFFAAVDPDEALAYVVVQHLDPDHGSTLPQLIARVSKVPVKKITDDARIEPRHAYVIPPDATLTLEDGALRLAPPGEPRGHRSPIDHFFLSLAADRGEDAACIILSGTGSDGTIGLRAIKEHGGLALAQADAEYDGMMRSAVATGLVDAVLPVEGIPGKIADYFRFRAVAPKQPESADHLHQVCALLRARTGHDFSGYKDKTVRRRIQRRMQVLQVETVPEFLERLRKDPRELDLLLQDLLIGVTQFFRDQAAFDALGSQAIPQLFEGKGPDDTVRVWVPGCATGEEAYSIAILLREYAARLPTAPKLQIFASDIDEAALDVARTGRYPVASLKDIPPQLRDRYFTREDGTCRVATELREICLFSTHNLLHDAPFSRLDLISCRNLLIYLSSELQGRVVDLFHYALRDQGFLFLGTSENVTRHSRLFSTVDKPSRIFRRRPRTDRGLPEFPLAAPEMSRRRPAGLRLPGTAEMSLQTLAERELLEQFAPAHVVINADGDVLHASARTGKYLELPVGIPDHSIFGMARRGLRLEMRAAVHKAVRSGRAAVQKNVAVGTNGGRQVIDLVVQPLRRSDSQDPLFLVVFQDVGSLQAAAEPDQVPSREEVESISLRQLEEELRTTRERLQTTTEELESSNEELKSGNEELSSMNEELQSANEELETSREELQSINEELQTVNAELNARVEELSRTNSDMANLLESTQIATIFLDRQLAVKSFTPAAKDLFRLVESDAGRPIGHVRARFAGDTVQDDAERVLRTLATVERQVQSSETDGRYIMRIMPYRTLDNVINGVVITFADVTRTVEAEKRISELSRDLRNRLDSLETLLGIVPVGILFDDAAESSGQIRINGAAARLLGEDGEVKGLTGLSDPLRLFMDDEQLPAERDPLTLAARTGRPVDSFEGQLEQRDGSRIDVMISATPLFDEAGKPRGAIASIVDITERKKSEARQQLLMHELQHRVKNTLAGINALAGRLLQGRRSAEDFVAALRARLTAMGRTNDLLARQNWRGASLEDLIRSNLSAYVGEREGSIGLRGPDVILTPGAAATLGMVLYELATNAAKYGALSKPEGRIAVAWQVAGPAEGDQLSLTWAEQDGPPVQTPEGHGFGMSFIQRSVEYELRGSVQMDFQPEGLRLVLTIPFARNMERDLSGTRDGFSET
ncbi:MAG: chemotaxis methyltransferase [Alphaproteobacteria bacterium]|nr:MAG: chemotaxis methyltransferase [Alphaproteobacteria bacterium]